MRVIVKQQDLEKSGLTERISAVSQEIIWQGDTVIIIPSWDLATLVQILSEEHVSYGIENFHLREGDG